jgi:hypothetical protein
MSAGKPHFKYDPVEFPDVLVKRTYDSGVKTVLNREADEQFIKEFVPDVLLFVAIGSKEIVPPVKGVNGKNVIMAIDAEIYLERLGKRVVITGDGLVDVRVVISFKHERKECTIIEMKSETADEVNPFYCGRLLPELTKAAKIYINTKVKEIIPSGAACSTADEEFTVEVDSVVLPPISALLMTSLTDFAPLYLTIIFLEIVRMSSRHIMQLTLRAFRLF